MRTNSRLFPFVFPALLLSALASPADSHADQAEPATVSGKPAAAEPARVLALGNQDFAWIAAAILTAIPAQLRYADMHHVDTSALDREKDLWAMDRWAAGLYSPKTALASDILVIPMVGLPMAATALEAWNGRQSWGAAFYDGVIFSEALALSSSLDLLVRSTQVHPRPLVYGKDVPANERLSGEASGSFYSGHANAAFLSAVYFSYTYSLRNPDSRYQGVVWAGSLGAAAGSFFGWAFPYMHRKKAGGSALGLDVGMNAETPYPLLTWTF